MTVRRLVSFALIAVATTGGCAASRVGQLPPSNALPERAPLAPAISDVVYRHNRNAELVQNVQATPSVSLQSRFSGGTTGVMVFERPHNFRFVVKKASLSAGKVADLGSNDDEFWFWANDKEDHKVYVARYDAPANPGGSELAFQPDWIVEALGLRSIPEDEARQIKKTRGREPGTEVWEHQRITIRGETIKKVTVLDGRGQVLQHQFFAPGVTTPVAIARPIGTKTLPLPEDPNRSVNLPEKLKLTLASSQPGAKPIEMELVLNDLKINTAIDDERRQALFSVPTIEGSTISRMDGDGQPPRRGDTSQPRIRQSLPAPPAGNGIELGEPAPMGADDAFLKKSDPMPLEPDLGLANPNEGVNAVVGTPAPRAANSAPRMARAGGGFPSGG